MRTRHRSLAASHLLTLGALLLAPPLAAATPAIAEETPPATETEADTAEAAPEGRYGDGFAIYQRYCRSCHGAKGRGDGHVAKFLKVPPTDLTRLTAENGGEFPNERVLTSIDGRQEMSPLHGRDMPIWGAIFQVEEDQTEADAALKLAHVIAYIKGIQAPSDASPEEPEAD